MILWPLVLLLSWTKLPRSGAFKFTMDESEFSYKVLIQHPKSALGHSRAAFCCPAWSVKAKGEKASMTIAEDELEASARAACGP